MDQFITIKTFKDVKFDKNIKPLVICDIDHTFMRCSHDLEHLREILYPEWKIFNSLGINPSLPNNDNEVINLMNYAYNIGCVKQTDKEGFNQMLKIIEQLGGKLVFLTARGISSHERTIKELKKTGLENPENYDIHYTNNEITKGEYIKKTNLINGYDHISFIDDYPSYLASVYNIFPNINCYLFKYDLF